MFSLEISLLNTKPNLSRLFVGFLTSFSMLKVTLISSQINFFFANEVYPTSKVVPNI